MAMLKANGVKSKVNDVMDYLDEQVTLYVYSYFIFHISCMVQKVPEHINIFCSSEWMKTHWVMSLGKVEQFFNLTQPTLIGYLGGNKILCIKRYIMWHFILKDFV